ncbi:MAG: NAD-binding protein, partial [Acidimicrobiaceae bacterium]|nr:NAD-binding protein [Acidimicrobiaceae bacterium]
MEAGGDSGPVIVCGLQPIGLRIVEQLHRSGIRVVVIDDDPDRRLLPTLEEWKIPFVLGSPRQRSVLLGAGLNLAVAAICVEDDDLKTLESALVVHDLRPELRVVAEIANPSVGRALGSVIGPDRVLDVASLAAPSLVQACLGAPTLDVRIEDVDFAVVSEESRGAGTLRERFGDLVPLAVVGNGGRTIEVCPGRDHPVAPGEVVTLIGTPAEMAATGLATHMEETATAEMRQRRWLRPMLPEFPGALRLALAAIAVVVVIATVVLTLGYRTSSGGHLGVLNALYFTVVTISTVGFGDFSYAAQAAWLRIFAIVLIITGVALATTLFATITNTLFSRSIANAFGRQRITRMHSHVVIVGLGSIGVRVVEGLLAHGRSVVAIERDEHNRHLARARALGVPILYGDATETATLDAANTQAASAVAALTSDDLTNVQTSLVLREYLADAGAPETPTVVRLFHRDLSVILERDFSFHAVRSTADLAAPWFLGAALGLGIT